MNDPSATLLCGCNFKDDFLASSAPDLPAMLNEQEGNMAKIVHANELPHSVMVFLKAKRGQIVEWVSAEPGKPIEPLLRKKAE